MFLVLPFYQESIKFNEQIYLFSECKNSKTLVTETKTCNILRTSEGTSVVFTVLTEKKPSNMKKALIDCSVGKMLAAQIRGAEFACSAPM